MDSLVLSQCQYFVTRKKRLCRMTVKPGHQYCGEHEPQPTTDVGKVNNRMPCPYDPKHTCYVSKLEKHLAICNARQVELPPYIAHNINAPPDTGDCPRMPLSEVPREKLLQVIDKINTLFQTYLQDKIELIAERPIHHTVLPEFSESDRTESSLRHLRQASSLLHIVEELGLVQDATCYLELGAGKGQLSYYACCAWCDEGGAGGGSCVALVERAALRHKRDNRARAQGVCVRVRADLAHVRLAAVPAVRARPHLVALAKHLCGVAMDYALRCLTAAEVRGRAAGAVLATCCHHRCERAAYVGAAQLQELGINGEDLNIMLGVVSWATCGDGRSRGRRNLEGDDDKGRGSGSQDQLEQQSTLTEWKDQQSNEISTSDSPEPPETSGIAGSVDRLERTVLTQKHRQQVGQRAKALLDWGRVLYLRECGFDARLCHYVPTAVSLENLCIVAKKTDHYL